jgi:predicted TIM-barrel fold metal-dependent hydrolase
VIDFHVHQPAGAAYEAPAYVALMDELAIDRSVVFTFDGLRGQRDNAALARFVDAAPERLVGFATVDPRAADAADDLAHALDAYSLRGVKLHPWLQGFSPHERSLDPICEVAAERDAPVLFHDGTPPYSAPLQIAVLARRHPRTQIVLGHGGLHDLWREAAAAAELPNVHVCLCATPPYAMRRLAERVPLERLLFGTDGGLLPTPRQPYVGLRVRQIRELGLTRAQLDAILDENPRRLLRLP